jgi:cytochrome bd-type quinol oxidase subunit 2
MSRLFQYSLITTTIALLSGILLFGAKVAAEPAFITPRAIHTTTQFADLIGANSEKAACSGINLGNDSNCSTTSGSSISSLLKDIINILSIIVGIVAVIMIIVGGLKYITSGGEANKTAAASKTIIYALIGLVVAVLAQVLVHFVLNRAISASKVSSKTTTNPTSPGQLAPSVTDQ